MGLDTTARRRWLGGIALGAALLMLLGGETVFAHRLQGTTLLLYWAVCFLFTGLAIFVAFRDARAMLKGVSREQRDLLENTLKKIANDAKARRGSGRKNGR